LDGIITVAFLGFYLQDGTRAGFDYGDGKGAALLVIDSGHSELAAEETSRHRELRKQNTRSKKM